MIRNDGYRFSDKIMRNEDGTQFPTAATRRCGCEIAASLREAGANERQKNAPQMAGTKGGTI